MNKINELIINEMHNRDCIEGMRELPSNSIDLTVSSPPYNIGTNYQGAYEDSKPFDEYKKFIIDSFREIYRISKDDAIVAIVVGNQRNSGLPHHYYFWLQVVGFKIIQEIIWVKASHQIPVEYILVCSKSGNYNKLYKENGFSGDKYYGNGRFTQIWSIGIGKGEGRKALDHDATFVKKIPTNFINISTKEEDVVLDPFAGVGTVLVAAKENNRQFIGFEISQSYINKTLERLNGKNK